MNSLSLILLIFGGLTSFSDATNPDSTEKNLILRFYEDLNCKKIIEITDDFNFTRFNCPDYKALDVDKCHLKGKSYNGREALDKDDLPRCDGLWFCRKDDKYPASFQRGISECPEHISPIYDDINCVPQYKSVKDCCISSSQICDHEEITKLNRCVIEGNTYLEGTRIYPKNEPCYYCLCTKDFNETMKITENPNCIRNDCAIELQNMEKLRNGCIPVYSESHCCPWRFKCPSENDAIELISSSNSTNAFHHNNSNLTCTFGELTMKLGDKLNLENIYCECQIPPYPTCVTTINFTSNITSSQNNANSTDNNLTCKFGELTKKLGDKWELDECTDCECALPPIPRCAVKVDC